MTAHGLVFSDDRTLLFGSLVQPLSDSLSRPFVTLLPAFDEVERKQAQAIVGPLVDRGCVEICCLGPQAEQLHDSIDQIVEERGALAIVTTWHTDYSDGCEYFLFAAGGRAPTLLALVSSHPELVALLEKGAQ